MDTSSTKAISLGNMLVKKIEDLNKETDAFAEDMDDSHTCCTVLQYNYALRSKELDLQCEEHNAQIANAEATFHHEHDLKLLDLEMKKVKENTLSQQIKLLHLQIQLKGMGQLSSSSSFPPGPSTGAEFSPN